MNNETRKILDKILATVSKDPNGMLFDKFNGICLENDIAPMYVVDFFMRFGLINTSNKQYFELTEKGVRFEGFESLEKSDKIAKSKARLEHRLLNFQVKTFWVFFILALFSSVYSIYDLSKDSEYYKKTEIEKMLKNYEKVEKP